MEEKQYDDFFWLELIEILKKHDNLKNISPKDFCVFVESLIEKYY